MVYIIFHNQTDAMRCRNSLQTERIIGVLTKAPRITNSGSCAWAVKISESEREHAKQICTLKGIAPCAWYSEQRGGKM